VEGASEGLPPRRYRELLEKSEILRGRGAFSEVLTKGRRLQGTHIFCYLLRVNSERKKAVPVQAGFAVSRSVKSAVKRNRVRRLMREAYRLNKGKVMNLVLGQERCFKIVFLYKESAGKNTDELELKDIDLDIQKTLITALTLE
jgi:ribonuclease P protein component